MIVIVVIDKLNIRKFFELEDGGRGNGVKIRKQYSVSSSPYALTCAQGEAQASQSISTASMFAPTIHSSDAGGCVPGFIISQHEYLRRP